jgi:ketosteroid isomerase-like protein
MRAREGLARWHAYMHAPTAAALDALLADDAVFHSPVVHSPQVGRAKVHAYLWAAAQVFGPASGFRYLREIVDGDTAVLEFEAVMDGITVNGIDMIIWNADGLITDFKVMVRPLKGINLLHQMMAGELSKRAS